MIDVDEEIENMLCGCAYEDTHGITEGIKALLRQQAIEVFEELDKWLCPQKGPETDFKDGDYYELDNFRYQEVRKKYSGGE